MGYTIYANLVFGWKLTDLPKDSDGDEIDPFEDKFLPYVEGHDGVKETIIYDQMCDEYMMFGILLGEVSDCGDFEYIDTSDLDALALRDKFREVFECDPPDELPRIILFIHSIQNRQY